MIQDEHHTNDTTKPQSSDQHQRCEQELTQEELLARYIEQQRRLSCPGCGEGQETY
ncbi:hypothetical protein [Aeoliella sp.]|uniref:hypothetical protein n=1 Tax=Aeoliella sp. TaxID=2795800 RepID=UPI003CCC1956